MRRYIYYRVVCSWKRHWDPTRIWTWVFWVLSSILSSECQSDVLTNWATGALALEQRIDGNIHRHSSIFRLDIFAVGSTLQYMASAKATHCIEYQCKDFHCSPSELGISNHSACIIRTSGSVGKSNWLVRQVQILVESQSFSPMHNSATNTSSHSPDEILTALVQSGYWYPVCRGCNKKYLGTLHGDCFIMQSKKPLQEVQPENWTVPMHMYHLSPSSNARDPVA